MPRTKSTKKKKTPKDEKEEISEESKAVIAKIKETAQFILNGFVKDKPVIEVPIRGKSNIDYNRDAGIIEIDDDGRVSERIFNNLRHAKKFMQYILVMNYCNKLLSTNRTSDIRDLYYSLKRSIPGSREKTFDDQGESNPIIEDIEVSMDTLRERLHISADPKGYIVGNVVFEQTLKDRDYEINCNEVGTGWGIPSNVESDRVRITSLDAKYLLAIESAGMYNRLVEEAFHEENDCILVALKGQASRGTRRLIRRISGEKDLPVYVFVDGDPWGLYIFSVLRFGSISLSYISDKIASPSAKFVGMTMTDIKEYGLEESTHPLNKVDMKRIDDLMNLPWFQRDDWQKELKLMKKLGVRIEQQALASKSLDFVATDYLPDKIKNRKFLS
ncbi:MAG: DNA topoisomerase VI [Candidatus Lokiarchaeota archaeon]|nr:DNA topoisomerase VI [Candidatus Lokiarchaeota archaeon]